MLFDGFRIAKFVFRFRAQEGGRLPEYKGGVLRGGFGHTFKSVVCVRKGKDCSGCQDRNTCAYFYIFETSPGEKSSKFSSYSDVPRPFVVEPGNGDKRYFSSGDVLEFGLVLMGKAIEYFPYFVFCFDELGRRGLGRERIRFRLDEVGGFDFQKGEWASVYDPQFRLLEDALPVVKTEELLKTDRDHKDTLSLEFLTPTRVKYRGKYISDLEFHVMIRNLLRRISMLTIFHSPDGGSRLDENGEDNPCKSPDFQAYINNLINKARMVDVRQWDLKWHDWERYSTRQNARMKLGGFVGKVTYTGDLKEFMPAVLLGEQIHIGKNTAFGLGKYCIN